MTHAINHKMVFAAACLGMLIFGIVMAVVGSVLPSVIVKFDIDKANAGSLFVMLSLGILVGSLIFGPIVDRFGYKLLMVIGTIGIILGFQGIAYAPSMNFLYVTLFICGFAGGSVNGGVNAMVSDISEGRRGSRLTYLGVFFGVGAIVVPMLLGSLLDIFTFEVLISGVGALVVLPLILFVSIRFPQAKHTGGFPVAEGLALTREITLLLLGCVLILQSGMEIAMGGWAAAYFNEVQGVDTQRAVLFLSLFWAGLMFSRMILGYLLLRFPAENVIRISFGLSFIGSLIMLLSNDTVFGVIGLILAGIGFAPVFPVMLAYAGDLYAKFSGTAFSILLVMALAGGMLIPFLIGVIADEYGLRFGLMLIPGCIAISYYVFHRVDQRMKKAKEEKK